MDKNAKSLVKKLLVADLTKRYGCVKGGAQDIKSHKWFTGFDFEALLARQIPAPIVPQVRPWSPLPMAWWSREDSLSLR